MTKQKNSCSDSTLTTDVVETVRQVHELAPAQSNQQHKVCHQRLRVIQGVLLFTGSWMLKVTRGPGEEASMRISGRSSTSPILELYMNNNATVNKLIIVTTSSFLTYFILRLSCCFSIAKGFTVSPV